MRILAPKEHWTVRYLIDRTRVWAHDHRYRDRPWLAPSAIKPLESLLKPSDEVAEFGSGRSTVWLAQRTRSVESLEHSSLWHARVRGMVERAGLENITLHLLAMTHHSSPADAYALALANIPHQSKDVVLNDGLCRAAVSLNAIRILRPAGLLIIDDVERYLPSNSRSPNAALAASREDDAIWREFESKTTAWRKLWFSSGVSDTAFFFSPSLSSSPSPE